MSLRLLLQRNFLHGSRFSRSTHSSSKSNAEIRKQLQATLRNESAVFKPEDFNLYFDSQGRSEYVLVCFCRTDPVANHRTMNLAQADENKLKLLSDACSPATFGLKQKVFATNFNPDNAGLIDIARSELLDGSEAPIRFGLYKLNVSGE